MLKLSSIITHISLIAILSGCVKDQDAHKSTGPVVSSIINGAIPTKSDTGVALSAVTLSYKTRSLPHCSGVLIAPSVVLTAAHCILAEEKGPMFVTLGTKVQITKLAEGSFEIENSIEVKKSIVNPDYIDKAPEPGADVDYLNSDLALVILSRDVPANFKPVSIYKGVDVGSLPDLPLYVAGFSPYSDTSIATAFDYVEFPDSKSEVFRGNVTTEENKTFENLLFRNVFALPFQKEKTVFKDNISYQQFLGGVCSGDSGGPTYIKLNNQYYLLGINSFTLETFRTCSSIGSSTVVSFHENWILKTLATENLEKTIQFASFLDIKKIKASVSSKNTKCVTVARSLNDLFGKLPGFNASEDIENNCQSFKKFLKNVKKLKQPCKLSCEDAGATKGFCEYYESGAEKLRERVRDQCSL